MKVSVILVSVVSCLLAIVFAVDQGCNHCLMTVTVKLFVHWTAWCADSQIAKSRTSQLAEVVVEVVASVASYISMCNVFLWLLYLECTAWWVVGRCMLQLWGHRHSMQSTVHKVEWVHCVVINPVLVLGVTFCRTALVAHLQDFFNVVLLVCVITVITISF